MNGAMVHLSSVHLPIALAIITLILFVFALATKSPGRLKFAVEMLVIGAVLSWPAFLSGEKAEHFLEDFVSPDGVALEAADPALHDVIHEHEEIAQKVHYGYQGLGLVGLISWFFVRKGEKFRKPLCIIGLVLSLVLTGAMGYTGYLGGHIRHLEVRRASAAPVPSDAQNKAEGDSPDNDHQSGPDEPGDDQ